MQEARIEMNCIKNPEVLVSPPKTLSNIASSATNFSEARSKFHDQDLVELMFSR